MSRRYLFLCPDRKAASGGIAVLYDSVVTLRKAGFEALIVHQSPTGGYPDYPDAPPMVFTRDWSQAFWKQMPKGRIWLKAQSSMVFQDFRKAGLQPLVLRHDDIIVAPEFMAIAAAEAFPQHELGVYVQNPFAFLRQYEVGLGRGLDLTRRANWMIGIAEICRRQFDLIGFQNHFHVPVSFKPEDFSYATEKEKLITYMPRKRPEEARLVHALLEQRNMLRGYRLQAIDNLSRRDVASLLRRSLIFISLMQHEALGFPAAEAMASGCITIGYTGLGTAEYFTPQTGIPVLEDDTAALVHATERAVHEYETDPARLDALRCHANAHVRQRFSKAGFETALLRSFLAIESQAETHRARLSPAQNPKTPHRAKIVSTVPN